MTTIFALSTPWGRSGVAVIRLSGPRARATLEALTGRPAPAPRLAVRRRLWADAGEGAGTPIDEAMVAYFPGPASYSGEDMVELGLHGGPAVIQAALAALAALPDHRLAEPGEFSRRAFHNGKLDLVEIEGLADLIAAETEAQRLQALRQAEGEASRLYEEWRGALVGLMALNEAMIDFSEDDILPEISERVNAGLIALGDEIERHLERSRSGERLRDGLMVAILGAPNAGKSSLLNRLSGREAAIVAATAGPPRRDRGTFRSSGHACDPRRHGRIASKSGRGRERGREAGVGAGEIRGPQGAGVRWGAVSRNRPGNREAD
jgi:tRNA modification GTPase